MDIILEHMDENYIGINFKGQEINSKVYLSEVDADRVIELISLAKKGIWKKNKN